MIGSDLKCKCQIHIDQSKRNRGVRHETALDFSQGGPAALEESTHRVSDLPVHGPWSDKVGPISDANERRTLRLARQDRYEGRCIDDDVHKLDCTIVHIACQGANDG